jgi:ribosomal protein S3
MHQTDYVSHHSFNTVIKNDVRVRQFITVTLNSEKIVNSNLKCRSL